MYIAHAAIQPAERVIRCHSALSVSLAALSAPLRIGLERVRSAACIYNASDCRAALSLEGEAWPDEWTADASRSNRPAATSPQPVGPHVDEWEVRREEMDDGFDDGCPFSGGAMKRGEEGELLGENTAASEKDVEFGI